MADFAFSTKVHRNEKLSKILGTSNYMSPELINKEDYYGQPVDIFAAGVVLFCMVVGHPPYHNQATKSDPFYNFFIEKKFNRFWMIIETEK